jgi:hypothetical protein
MSATQQWRRLSASLQGDRRREVRHPAELEIDVSGIDSRGIFFAERTGVQCVSESGCRFSLGSDPVTSWAVAIKLRGEQAADTQRRTVLFEVRWIRKEQSRWLVGARRMQREHIWPASCCPSTAGVGADL